MKRSLLAFLALVLLAACSPSASIPATPTAMGLAPLPTPKTPYTILGTTKSNYMVLVDPADAANRPGLQAVGDYLCAMQYVCKIWFWDDPDLASSGPPFSPESEAAVVAYYHYDIMEAAGILTIYSEGTP